MPAGQRRRAQHARLRRAGGPGGARDRPGGRKVFAGQRADAFHVDLGSIFDLGALRPFNSAHLISMPNMDGVNAVQSYNVHTIAIQVPIDEVTRGEGVPTDPASARSVIGVWATASRRKGRVFDAKKGKYVGHGPWVQVSRLGNPLFNEVIVPMAEKDAWNAATAGRRREVHEVRQQARARRAAAGALPGCVPEPRGVQEAAGRPQRDPADRDPVRRRAGLPELHGAGAVGHAAAQRGDPAERVAQLARAGGRRRGRLPQRPADRRRRGDDRAPGDRRAHAPAGRPVLHPGRRRQRRRGRDDATPTRRCSTSFPYLGLPGGGYQTEPGTTQAAS